MKSTFFDYLLSLADSHLVLGHRLSEWAGRGPMLEEDIALSNLGLDVMGIARSLYSYAGKVEGQGQDEDQLAYFRDATAYRNLLLVEQPNGDFAHTIVRHFFFAVFFNGFWQAATHSSDNTLAGIAGKAIKELKYHQRHSAEWLIRLGDGTQESHDRSQMAINIFWSYTGEMFAPLDTDVQLIEQGLVPDPSSWQAQWRAVVDDVTRTATLILPQSEFMRSGGRAGQHTEHLGYLLATMQHLQRSYPGASW